MQDAFTPSRPDESNAYHELAHAADDGKVLNDARTRADFASSHYTNSDLGKKIDAYNDRLLNDWSSGGGRERFERFSTEVKQVNELGARIQSGQATPYERQRHAELKARLRGELTDFTQTFWFVDWGERDGKTFWVTLPSESTPPGKPSAPYLLHQNTELIARAVTMLEYGSPQVQSRLRSDAQLMEIVNPWKEMRPHVSR